jgi:glycosyltransferase involved in cell wall biosynthesis
VTPSDADACSDCPELELRRKRRIVIAFARAGADVLRLEQNRGKGFAMQRGIDRAHGDILLFIDADGQDDPAEIPLLISAFEPDIDLVLGSRFIGHFRPGAITRMNYYGTRFITGSVNLLFGIHVTDPLAGFRAVRSRVFQDIRIEARGYDIEVDLLIRVVRNGGHVAEVPASRSARPYGASGLSSIRDGSLILWRALSLRFARTSRPAPAPSGSVVPVTISEQAGRPDNRS